MEWEGGRRSGNIEDRRGLGPVGIAGGGIGAVVLAAIGYFVFGVDPRTTLEATQRLQQPVQQEGVRGQVSDAEGQFVDVIETSNRDVWTPIFRQEGVDYRPPAAIVLYEQSTGTGCGTGQSAMGPFYCPADQKVYLDLSFWQELEARFGAKGEFARAYVISHEVGHHVQHLLGADQQARRLGARGEESGSVRLELQADCYAGVWAARAGDASGGGIVINPADIEDGLGAAAAVGDDTIQKRSQGQVVPDSFTHGSSAQRMRWFRRGFEQGDPAACDTFSASRL
ncbi:MULTISPECIES: neutral zinc metallopeptidase [unclassified Caulobacter]|jgi:predicted metalloprotease|uniref:KPN_02809 family neutral zinc metallopeptidase n=1 Tax=unclassified Caulobacter TaxID=2648921 RepID=UPI0007846C92|nr:MULTISPECIES: neutral zinc metallopeptidase [unclassified Caulobacter]AZS20996.1 flagellar biosynthesis protein FlgM [Caulobacter sp. FWC26]